MTWAMFVQKGCLQSETEGEGGQYAMGMCCFNPPTPDWTVLFSNPVFNHAQLVILFSSVGARGELPQVTSMDI